MSDVRNWLDSIGLGQYADAFEENAIDAEILPDLTDADLEKIGVKLGHRKKLLKLFPSFDPAPLTATSVPRSISAGEAERRQLSVMFCDLVGSTSLSEGMDPEEYRDVLAAYQSAALRPIAQHDGYVARYMGDGLLVYFGYPRAHEADPEQAVRAGLGVVDAVNALGPTVGIELHVRVGIATGLVVAGDIVGEGASEERAVLGDTPNLAARLQGLAQPAQVLIDETTRRLVGEAFEFESLGAQSLKGFSESSLAWRAVGESDAQSRFHASHGDALTKLVGREHELGLLLERWMLSRAGEGQVVLLSGEAGIGKSRMIEALRERIGREPCSWLRHQCAPHHANSAFHPVIERLEREIAISAADSGESKLDKLQAWMGRTAMDATATAPLFAALLSLPGEHRYGPLGLTPEQRRDRTFAALAGEVLALSRERPVVFVFEDAHWIDPSSEDLLGEIMSRSTDAAVFMLITHRPGYTPPWTGFSHRTSLTINRLSRDQTVAIVKTVGGHELSAAMIDGIIARADGVPLFVEELTKSVLEVAGSGDVDTEGQIPTTLRASLTARMDRLGDAKDVAQIGAALGREFSIDLVTAVARKVDIEVEPALERLETSELLFRRVTSQGTVYSFKHALVQEAAYETMLKRRRAELHRQIAEVLESEFPSTVEFSPEILARHYTEGNAAESAIAYWQRAGELCVGASANVEASDHFATALGLLATLPETSERDARELALRIASGGPLLMTRGHGSTEVAAAYSRARELSAKLGDTLQLMPVLFGLWRHFIGRGDCRATRDLGRQLLDLGVAAGDVPGRILGHYALGFSLFCGGEVEGGRDHFESGCGLYDRGLRDSLAFRLGQDPGVACLSYGALARWVLGYPDAAARRAQEALSLAREISDPFSQAYALSLAAQVYQLRGDVDTVFELSEKAIAIARENRFAVWIASPTIFRGWARARRGETEAGVEEMREGVAAICDAGMEMRRPLYLALVAEGLIGAGRRSEARIVVSEALTVIDATGEHWSEAEQHRLIGEIAVPDDPVEAEASFERALDVARAQKARSWEFRSALSLSRMLRDQGRIDEAARVLRPPYEWSQEGVDTPDRVDAKKLLDELSGLRGC